MTVKEIRDLAAWGRWDLGARHPKWVKAGSTAAGWCAECGRGQSVAGSLPVRRNQDADEGG